MLKSYLLLFLPYNMTWHLITHFLINLILCGQLNHPECAIRVPAIVSSIEKSGILGNAFNNRVIN